MNGFMNKLSDYSRKYVAQILLVLIVILFAILKPDTFFTMDNLLTIIRQVATTGIVALGVSFLMLTGNLDFSVGKLYAFAGVATALMYQAGVPMIVAILISVLMCVVLSLVTGVIALKFNIPMLIVSIAMMQVIDGLNMVITNGATVYGLPNSIKFLGQGYVLGIPVAVIIFLVIALIVAFVLNKTYMGRYFFAVGGSNDAARLSGINTTRWKILVYMVSGLFSAYAGLIMSSRLGSAQPQLGAGYESEAIAAAVIGGTSMSGGEGSMIGTLIGILIIGIIANGLNLLGVAQGPQKMVKGMIIVVAVIIDVIRRKASQSSK